MGRVPIERVGFESSLRPPVPQSGYRALAGLDQWWNQTVVGENECRTQTNGLLVLGDPPVQVTLLIQNIPQTAVGLRESGVDRLSFGAQSFDHVELKLLERHHNPDDVPRSVETARKAGFRRINVDLIYAIPDVTYIKKNN